MEALDITKIHNEYYLKLLNFITMKIRSKESAEELTNDVFMKIHDKIDQFDPNKANFNTWIWNIAKNAVIDHWRKVRKDDILLHTSDWVDDNGVEFFMPTDNSLDPQSELINSELGMTIAHAVNSLPNVYRSVADLHLLKQMSYEEVSKTLDSPLGTIKGQIHRAKEMLKERLTNL